MSITKDLAFLGLAAVIITSCGDDTSAGAGAKGGPCYDDGTCDQGLICNADQICEPASDPCAGVDCTGHGSCVVQDGAASCNCDQGYHAQGLECLADSDPCQDVDCSGHGTCDAAGGTAVCSCNEGYHAVGLDCVEDIHDDRIDIGFTSSLNKVYFEEPTEFAGTMTTEGTVELAQNEYEGIQLVLFPNDDISDVTIDVADLVDTSTGSTISHDDIEIDVVGYVNLLEPKVDGDRIGWIPDPLLPNQSLDLKNGVLQPYLITVHTREDTTAGTYQGSITISSGGQVISNATLTVTVWNFALPHVPRFKTANFAGWGSAKAMWPDQDFTNEQKRAVMEALAELGFRNRLPPTIHFASGLVSWNWNGQGNTTYGYPTHDGDTFNAERTGEMIDFLLDHGANHFFLGITSDIYKFPDKVDQRRANLVKYLQDYYDYLVTRGLVDMVYIYNVDEAWGADQIQHAHDTYDLIKTQVSADLTVMQNSNKNTDTMFDDFLGYFDAFDINLGFYDVNDSDHYRQTYPDQFTDFWWNVNIWPDSHPNLFVEYPLFDARIIGPLSYLYKMQGFEYWQIFSKGSIGNYHPVEPNELRVQWDVDNHSLDGCLVYPSSDGRIFSSLRYESFRDGMEDQAYLYLLGDLDPGNALLNVPIITGLTEFSNDQDEVLGFRRQVAQAIESHL